MRTNRIIGLRSWAMRSSLVVITAGCLVPASLAQPPAGPAPDAGAARPGQPGSPPGEKPEEPPTPAERDIDAAIKKVASLKSVTAELVQEINTLNQKYSIKGSYRKGPNNLVYLRLTVTGLADSDATSLQVCDGETLWDYQVVLTSRYYRKMSVKPILERLHSPELNPKLRDTAIAQMGMSGPETLLLGLRKALRFDLKEEDELDGKKVWKFRGTWMTRQGLVGLDTRPVAAAGFLPPYIPMDATLYLGKEDGWPYKLVLVGRKPSILESRRLGPDGRPVFPKGAIEKIIPSEIKLTYQDVKLNAKLRLDEFVFQAPPSENVDDNTEAIIKGLDQAIQMEIQRKKNESAKKESPVLDQQPTGTPAPPDAAPKTTPPPQP
jgi:outer membrane lipoprotein-sorting protein